jgi:hypothetical protein
MGKEISVYNLADGIADEQYLEYVKSIRGPFLESLPSVRKFEIVRTKGAVMGDIYRHVYSAGLHDTARRFAPLNRLPPMLLAERT